MKINAAIKTNQSEQRIIKEADSYKIFLKNEPKNNKANEELIKLLENYFNKKVIKIVGFKSHKKTIELSD